MLQVSAVGWGDISSDGSLIPLCLHGRSGGDAPASLLPLVRACSLCPTVPKASPLPDGSCFPRAGSAWGTVQAGSRLPRELPEGLPVCQELPARSITSGGAGGYRLALRPARDSGISSGMARLGQALFWGSRCLGFLMSSPRDRDDQLGALSGIDLAGKPSSLAGLGEPGLGWDLLPQEPRLCCTLSCAGFPFPFAPWRGPGSFPTQVEVEGCRQGWRDSFCHSQPPPDRAFPH